MPFPRGMELHPGQRVSAPLRGRARIGMVVDLRYGDETGLEAIARPVDGVAVLSRAALELGHWAAEESLSSWGSTLLSLSPPPARRGAEVIAPPPEIPPALAPPVELWVGDQRDARLGEQLRDAGGSALVIAPDLEGAARWAERLDAPRLDSGVSDAARRAAWFAAARGRARIVVGTRSALLAPLPPPATLVLLEEHDPAHKPPGAPRLHSRELAGAPRVPRGQPSADALRHALRRELVARPGPARHPAPYRYGEMARDHHCRHAGHPEESPADTPAHAGDRGDDPARAARGPRRHAPGGHPCLRGVRRVLPLPGVRGAAAVFPRAQDTRVSAVRASPPPARALPGLRRSPAVPLRMGRRAGRGRRAEALPQALGLAE